MLTPSHRTLVQALAVSLLLHTALLASAVKSYPVRLEVAAVTINAVLRERGAAGALLSAPPTRASGELARPSAPEAHGDVARKAQAEAALAVEPRENSPAAPNALDAPGSAGRPAGVAAIGSAPSPGSLSGALSSAAPSAASGAGNDGVSADDLRQYRVSLASAARRFRQYPALARQRGWEGTVEVALSVSALRAAPEVALVRSSGRRVLDEQALDMLAQAARVTSLPEGLKARDFRILLPVQFSLADEQ